MGCRFAGYHLRFAIPERAGKTEYPGRQCHQDIQFGCLGTTKDQVFNNTLLCDPFIGCATEACAVGDGSTVPTFIEATTNEHTIVKYDTGACTVPPNCTVVRVNGGCDNVGTIHRVIEGCNVSGALLIKLRSAQVIANCDVL